MTQSTNGRRGTQVGALAWIAIIAASAVVHGAVVATVEWEAATFIAPPKDDDKVSVAQLVSYSCELEAAVASAVDIGLCATPFGRGDDCAARAANAHRLAYLGCKKRDEEVVVSMIDIDKIKVEKILPIEPLDEVVAAQLLSEEIVKQVEQVQKQVMQRTATGQVIEITPPPVEIAPDNARYLSEYDSKVEKQTVARGSTEEMVSKPSPKELPVAKTPNDTAEKVASLDPRRVGDSDNDSDNHVEKTGEGKSNSVEKQQTSALAMRGVGSAERDPQKAMDRGALDGSQDPISDDGLRSSKGDGNRQVDKTELDPAGGGTDGGGVGGSRPNLVPSEETMQRTVGGGSVDKIDDAESGDFTALNSKKWKFASFFNRLKRRVAQHWHPDQVYLRRDPTGKVYGTKDRITVLAVTLTSSGALSKVVIAQPSGVDFLDDEAVRAFREAGPFPNPPSGLADSSGEISFSFGFHFEIGGRPDSWRIFRYR